MLLTKTLLIVGQEGTTQRQELDQREAAERGLTAGLSFEVLDPKLVAFDKATGELVGEVVLPRNVTAAPMTYMLDDRQYVVVTTGGGNLPAELIVLSLP